MKLGGCGTDYMSNVTSENEVSGHSIPSFQTFDGFLANKLSFRVFTKATRLPLSGALGEILFVALSYYIAGRLGILTAIPPGLATAIWPASGIAVAACLLLGYRVWPGIFVGSFLLNVVTLFHNPSVHSLELSIFVAFCVGIGSSVQALLAASLAKRFLGKQLFSHSHNVFRFTIISAVSCLLAATVATTSLTVAGFTPRIAFNETWLTWWLGDLAGILVLTPVLVMGPLDLRFPKGLRHLFEGFTILGVFVLLMLAGLSETLKIHPALFSLVLVVFVFVAAFRLGYLGTFSALLIAISLSIWGTARGLGPFVGPQIKPNDALLVLQGFVVLATLMGNTVVAVLRERDRVEDSFRRFKFIADNSRDPAFLVDENGSFSYFNTAAWQTLGYLEDELRTMTVFDIDPFLQKEEFLLIFDRVFDGEFKSIETVHRTKKGQEIPVEVSASPFVFDGKRFFFAIARDISDSKKAEIQMRVYADQLGRTNKELEQFASVASHDLKAPLRNISNCGQLLAVRLKGKLNEEETGFLSFVSKGVEDMQRLIDSLLEYSRIGWEKETLEKIDVKSTVLKVLDTLKPSIEETGAQIILNNLPIVHAHSIQIEILFQNLISNSLKFKGERYPRVEISAKRSNGNWIFSILDNGIGIRQGEQEKAFQAFQRLHPSDKYPGSGIGLATCRKVAEAHGGKIWMESKEGSGTAIYFSIPDH
jgi:PAS domain S-box-containing protein